MRDQKSTVDWHLQIESRFCNWKESLQITRIVDEKIWPINLFCKNSSQYSDTDWLKTYCSSLEKQTNQIFTTSSFWKLTRSSFIPLNWPNLQHLLYSLHRAASIVQWYSTISNQFKTWSIVWNKARDTKSFFQFE